MKLLDVVQGSQEWRDARDLHYCASDAPAMMGVSKYESRTDFVRRKATGIKPEIDQATQARFDRGHATEEAARAIVEQDILGEDLFPVVATDDSGFLLASYDGLTMSQ